MAGESRLNNLVVSAIVTREAVLFAGRVVGGNFLTTVEQDASDVAELGKHLGSKMLEKTTEFSGVDAGAIATDAYDAATNPQYVSTFDRLGAMPWKRATKLAVETAKQSVRTGTSTIDAASDRIDAVSGRVWDATWGPATRQMAKGRDTLLRLLPGVSFWEYDTNPNTPEGRLELLGREMTARADELTDPDMGPKIGAEMHDVVWVPNQRKIEEEVGLQYMAENPDAIVYQQSAAELAFAFDAELDYRLRRAGVLNHRASNAILSTVLESIDESAVVDGSPLRAKYPYLVPAFANPVGSTNQ